MPKKRIVNNYRRRKGKNLFPILYNFLSNSRRRDDSIVLKIFLTNDRSQSWSYDGSLIITRRKLLLPLLIIDETSIDNLQRSSFISIPKITSFLSIFNDNTCNWKEKKRKSKKKERESELKISVARMRKTRSRDERERHERLRRRQRAEESTCKERRGFGGSRFLLEAHLEKATAMHEEQKGGKNARKPSGGRGGKREPVLCRAPWPLIPRLDSLLLSCELSSNSLVRSSLDPFSTRPNTRSLLPLFPITIHRIWLILRWWIIFFFFVTCLYLLF